MLRAVQAIGLLIFLTPENVTGIKANDTPRPNSSHAPIDTLKNVSDTYIVDEK